MSYNSPLLQTVIRRAPPGGGPTHHVYLARPTHVPQFIHKEVRFRDKRVELVVVLTSMYIYRASRVRLRRVRTHASNAI